MKTINVFILAAGYGERLRPITDHIPKPLLPVLGKPVLEIILERISNLPLNKIGINLHYHKKAIGDLVAQSGLTDKIELFPEESILGTGGALKNAYALLREGIFLVHNADILSDIDLESIIEAHLSSENLATLAVHDYPEFNNLAFDERGLLLGAGKKNIFQSQVAKWLAFTGIAVYSPDFLSFIPQGASGVVNAWLNAISKGNKIGICNVTGCHWSDIGTPRSYARAVINKLREEGETLHIHPTVDTCDRAELGGYVAIERGNMLSKGMFLRNCIVLPGSLIEGEAGFFENCIICPGFTINVDESDLLGPSEIPGALLIGTGGSDRKYFRIKRERESDVFMQCTVQDPDFQRHIEYTNFFREHDVPVPELIEADFVKKTALFEDLGDLSLYSWLKCKRSTADVERMYKLVLDMLISVHTVAYLHVKTCPLLHKRTFDYEHLKWETSYFVENFVEGLMNISTDNLPTLHDEFHRLALLVDSFPKTIVHRDFQSQNIMIKKGYIPRLLDYQGARIGPPAYDVASILWDPYYRLDDALRENLIDYYISRIETTPPSPNFHDTLLPCRLQRHMQALGAYGFLSLKKGKCYFLKHVPEGLRLLREDASLSRETYPVLYGLVMKLSGTRLPMI